MQAKQNTSEDAASRPSLNTHIHTHAPTKQIGFLLLARQVDRGFQGDYLLWSRHAGRYLYACAKGNSSTIKYKQDFYNRIFPVHAFKLINNSIRTTNLTAAHRYNTGTIQLYKITYGKSIVSIIYSQGKYFFLCCSSLMKCQGMLRSYCAEGSRVVDVIKCIEKVSHIGNFTPRKNITLKN